MPLFVLSGIRFILLWSGAGEENPTFPDFTEEFLNFPSKKKTAVSACGLKGLYSVASGTKDRD